MNAVERLCSGALLAQLAEAYVVEVLVAALPPGIKDPGEFVETRTKSSKTRVAASFRREVLEKATDWAVWYLDLLLSRYDPRALRGAAGSFGEICDRISEFISTFPNPADRTIRVHEVAGSLAEVIAKESGGGEVSSALRIQLESDLISMVTRKAGAKESVERRIESVDGMSSTRTKETLEKMGRGESLGASDEDSKLSVRALKASKRNKSAFSLEIGGLNETAEQAEGVRRPSKTSTQRRERRRLRRQTVKPVEPPLTPHFSGFEFENQSDADWLGLSREKVS